MEHNNGYSVTFYPISMEEGRPSFIGNDIIAEEDKTILFRMHMEVNNQYVASASKEFLVEKFANNFFCSCFESGVALFRFTPTQRNVIISGVFVEKNRMRTLWNLYLPYLIYMFVANKFIINQVRDITLNELIDMCNNAVENISDDDIDLANDIINTLQQRKTPFSFVYSRLPQSMTFAGVENLIDSSSDESTVSNIVFDQTALTNAKSMIMHRYPEAFKLRFCMASPREFIALCTDEIKTLCDKRYRKDFLKKLNNINSKQERIWFFCYSESTDCNYYIQIVGAAEEYLNNHNGMIPMNMLIGEMKKANQKVIDKKRDYVNGPRIVRVASESLDEYLARQCNTQAPQTSSVTEDQMPSISAPSSIGQNKNGWFKHFKK